MGPKKGNNDDLIQELWDIIQVKRNEIEKIEKPIFKTTGSFPWDLFSTSAGDRLSIHVTTDLDALTKGLALLIEKQKSYNEACNILKIERGVFKWAGFSYEDWENDFKARVAKILISNKKQNLNEYETKLNSMISPERKVELELAEIKKILTEK